MPDDQPKLLQFPSEFILKVMGKNSSNFEGAVLKILHQHIPDLSEGAITLRESKNNNFLAMTITFTATSQEQLDQIYLDLSASDEVLMTL